MRTPITKAVTTINHKTDILVRTIKVKFQRNYQASINQKRKTGTYQYITINQSSNIGFKKRTLNRGDPLITTVFERSLVYSRCGTTHSMATVILGV